MQSVTNLAGAAMRVYDKEVYEQVFKQNVLAQNLRKNLGVTSSDGTQKFLTVHHGRNTGHAAGSESLTLPTAGNQSYKQATVDMKFNFHQVQLTDVILEASKNNMAYLVNALDGEYEGAKNDMMRQIQRQWYSTGTGELGKFVSLSTNTFTVGTPMTGKSVLDYIDSTNILNISTGGTTAANICTVDYLIGDSSTIVGQSSFEAVAGHGLSPTIGDLVTFAQSATQNNHNNEMSGLKLLIDDGTQAVAVQGLNRVTTPPYYIWWRSYVNQANANRTLTEKLMQTTYLQAKKFGDPKLIVTSYDLFQGYGLTLTPDRRYVGVDQMGLYGGFTGVKFNDSVIVPDFDCQYNSMYFIDPSSLSIEELTPVSFMDKDGAILARSLTQPAYQATLRYYANLAVNKPRASSVLSQVIGA